MRLSRKELEQTLFAHHRIAPDKQDALRARIKSLQRMGFPPGSNVGRGPKMAYSAEHLFQLATVIELQQIGLPAERAIAVTHGGWRNIRSGYGAAFDLFDSFEISDERMLGFVVWRTLSDLQVDGAPFPDGNEKPFAFAITASNYFKRLHVQRTIAKSYGNIVLRLSDTLESLLQSVQHVCGIDPYDKEIAGWSKGPGFYVLDGHPLTGKSHASA